MRAQRSAAERMWRARSASGPPCPWRSIIVAWATTMESGLFSSWLTPASSEPRADSFSDW